MGSLPPEQPPDAATDSDRGGFKGRYDTRTAGGPHDQHPCVVALFETDDRDAVIGYLQFVQDVNEALSEPDIVEIAARQITVASSTPHSGNPAAIAAGARRTRPGVLRNDRLSR